MKADRARKKRWLFEALGVMALLALALAAVFCLPLFRVGSVAVAGNHYLSEAEICRIAAIYPGQHLLQVETDTAARTLMKDLRIKKAAVRRALPNVIVIEIEERRPIASIACEYGFLDLGGQGMVLQAYRSKREQPLPFLQGVSVGELYIGDKVSDEYILRALAFLAAMDEGALSQLTELNLSDPGHVVAHTGNTVEIRLGSFERWEEKAQLTQKFLGDLRVTKYQIEYMDLTYTAPFVKFRKP